MKIKLSEPSLGGSSSCVTVGRRRYGLPPGARVVWGASRRVAWVLCYGELRAFTAAGEVQPIPQPVAELVRSRLFSSG